MTEKFNLPALFLGVFFLAALGAITHLGMIIKVNWLFIVLPVALGAFYSFQLYRLATVWTPKSVFRNSFLVIFGGFVVMFLFMLSCHYFPELYPANNDRSEDITFNSVIFTEAVFFAVLPIIFYSVFALWLPTNLAADKSGRGVAIVHGGFWGMSLLMICFTLGYATSSFFSGVAEELVRGNTIFFCIDVVIGIGSFVASSYHDI